MAITFTQERQKQKNLIIVSVAAILATAIVLWWGFFGGVPERAVVVSPVTLRKVEINFETLKKPELQALKSFPEIAAFEGEIGRDNPFRPY